MFCDPLDLPDDVIAAQEAGELVIFAGAGISLEHPSNIPLFKDLTDNIGAAINKTRDPLRDDLDVLLGEWKDSHGARVHEAAYEIVSNPKSRPTEVHFNLLKLFKKPEHIRIVTTNYDRHFTTVAAELKLQLPIYRAPALPLGDDFHGVVFLHGCVEDEEPKRLILTDSDFGRAYLTQGWARTFLQALYAHFHVLFIGFSHADRLLTYLARGLPSRDRRKRYTIQSHPKDYSHWKQLGIQVIPYELPHNNLAKGLERWVKLSSLKPQDVRKRIHQIIDAAEGHAIALEVQNSTASVTATAAIKLSRDEEDFLRRAFLDPVRTKWFTERARDIGWITWLSESKILPPIFQSIESTPLSDVQSQLTDWAIETLITSCSEETRPTFVKLGGAFGPNAWPYAVKILLRDTIGTDIWKSPHLEDWLVAVLNGCHQFVNLNLVSALITRLIKQKKDQHALSLFETLFHVHREWSEEWHWDESVSQCRPTAKLACQFHALYTAWDSIQSIRSPTTDYRLLRTLLKCIDDIYTVSGSLGDKIDPVAGMRIILDEPRGSHDPSDSEELITVMLVDLLRERGTSAHGIGEEQILSWLAAPQVGWHRFAYYALRVDEKITPSRKLQIIIDYDLIFPKNWQIQNDPQSLVIAIFCQLSAAEKRCLLDIIESGPKTSAPESRLLETVAAFERNIYNNLIQRLKFTYPSDPEIEATHQKLGLKLPRNLPNQAVNDAAPPNAGVFCYRHVSPLSVKDLLSQSVESQIDHLISYENDNKNWGEPNRAGLVDAIASAAEQDLEWARALITSLIFRNITEGDIWERLAWRLNWHTKDPEFRRWFLLEAIPQIDPKKWKLESWRSWSYNLFRLGASETTVELSFQEWESLLQWSLHAWQATRSSLKKSDFNFKVADILTQAINDPAGRAVEFWLNYVSHIRRTQPCEPFEWPLRLQEPIAQLMDTDGHLRLLGLAILGQHLSFVRYANPEWTKSKLYPLLNFQQHQMSALCLWTSWLHYGRISPELAIELPPHLSVGQAELLKAGEETARRFLTYVAIIATSPFASDKTRDWLVDILRNSTPELRAWWIQEVGRCVRESSSEQQKNVWKNWAKEHLQSCSLGTFGETTPNELSEFICWPVEFTSIADEAFTLIQKFEPTNITSLDIFYRFKQSDMAKLNPDFTGCYFDWLFKLLDTGTNYYYGLDELIDDFLITQNNCCDMNSIAAHLLEKGYTAEAEMLFVKINEFRSQHRAD